MSDPVVVALISSLSMLAGVIGTAIIQSFRLERRTEGIHTLVNSRLTEALNHIAELERQLDAALAAAAPEAAVEIASLREQLRIALEALSTQQVRMARYEEWWNEQERRGWPNVGRAQGA